MALEWNVEQKQAIDQIQAWVAGTREGLFLSLTGAAGTGKTSILLAIKPFLEGKEVCWTAMTGKAALRVNELVGVEATTLHAVLYRRPTQGKRGQLYFNSIRSPECKFLVIDESSMTSPTIYMDLQGWKAQGVKVLFVGDGYQLPPVMSYKETKKYGNDFSVFKEVPGLTLTRVMRSGDDIIDVATQLRETNNIPKVSNGGYSIVRSRTPGRDAVQAYLEDNEDHVIVTWRNDMRMKANRLIRQRLGMGGVLPNNGEPVSICKNGQDVLNGEIHLVNQFDEGPTIGSVKTHYLHTYDGLQILVSTQGSKEAMDGSLPEVKDWRSFHLLRENMGLPEPIPVTYGYVSTAHRVQGSEFSRVTIFLSQSDLQNPHFTTVTKLPNGDEMPFASRFLYTSLTRAKHRVSLILGK